MSEAQTFTSPDQPIAHQGHSVMPGLSPDAAPDAAIAALSQHLAPLPLSDFLTEYALLLSKELNADFLAIGRLNPFSNMMRTVRFVMDGKIVDNMVYALDGTPCAHAMNTGFCFHADGVVETYPLDQELVDFSIKGYCGIALRNANGDPLGIITMMARSPITNEAYTKALLDHFHKKVAAVMEATEQIERYQWAVTNTVDGIWDWDIRTGGTTISQRILDIIGAENNRGPCDLTDIEDAIHPEDREHHTQALKRHLAEGTDYNLKLRLKNKDGCYRWYKSSGCAMRDQHGKPTRMIGGFCDIHDLIADQHNCPEITGPR